MANLEHILELNNKYKNSYGQLEKILLEVLEKGEVTQTDLEEMENSMQQQTEDYNKLNAAQKQAQTENLQEQIDDLQNTKLDMNIDTVIDLLTNGGRSTAISVSDDGTIILNAGSLEELNQIKLSVDEQRKRIDGVIADTEVEQLDGTKVKLKVLYSTLSQTVNGIETNVGTIEGVANDANSKAEAAFSKASQLKQTMDGFTTKVQSMESTLDITITGVYNEFYVSTSATELIGGSWSTTRPSSATTGYIWMRTAARNSKGEITYDDPTCISGIDGKQGPPGEKGDPGSPGEKGDDGVSITNTEIFYYVHTSKTSAPDVYSAGWTKNLPDYVEGKFLWYVTKITYSDRTSTFTTPAYLSSWEAKHESAKAISVANQTAEMFQWIVQKGSTQSSITLTDATIQAIANSDIKLKAKNISLEGLITANGSFRILEDGRAEIDSLSVDKEISTDVLTINTINNSRYQPVLDEDVTITIDNTSTNSDEFENGSTYTSIFDFQEACPTNLNGHEVTLIFASNYEGNLYFATQNNGRIILNFNNHTINGYLYFGIKTMEYEFADNNNGVIMPNNAYVGDNGNYSVFVYNTSLKIKDVTIYAGNGSGNNSGIEFSSFAQGKIDNVSFVNCYNAVRAYVQSKVHCASSNGTTSSYAFYSLSGSDISLSTTTQVSRSSGTKHYNTGSNGIIRAEGATFNGTTISGTNTNTNTSTENKTITLTADYGDTYRKTVYNNWKKDGTVRQGDYGYGDCVGCWFFGNKLSNYANKNISKIVITFTRQSGGSYGEVLHGVKTHNYSSRPSGTPSFRNDFSKSVSVGVGSTGTITLTSSTDISNFMKAKGVGLVPASQDKAHYSVCSGTCKIKITYAE